MDVTRECKAGDGLMVREDPDCAPASDVIIDTMVASGEGDAENPNTPVHVRRCCAPKTWLTREEFDKYSAIALTWAKNPWHWPIMFLGLVVVLSGSLVALLILQIVPLSPEDLRLFILEINFQILCGIFALAAILMHPQRVMWWYHWHCKERPEKWKQTFPFHKDRPGETLVIIILMNFNSLTSEGLGVLMWVTAATWQLRSQAAMGLLTILSFGSGLVSGILLGVRTAQHAKAASSTPSPAPAPAQTTAPAPLKTVDSPPPAPEAEAPTSAVARSEALAAELAIQVGFALPAAPAPRHSVDAGVKAGASGRNTPNGRSTPNGRATPEDEARAPPTASIP